VNNNEHELVLGMLADYVPEPPPEPTETPLPLDELTKEIRLHRRALEDLVRQQRVTNEALKVLADQGVAAWHQMSAVMQQIWTEHTDKQKEQ
jgi:hypothetical protein